jgi:hypothetical protein
MKVTNQELEKQNTLLHKNPPDKEQQLAYSHYLKL